MADARWSFILRSSVPKSWLVAAGLGVLSVGLVVSCRARQEARTERYPAHDSDYYLRRDPVADADADFGRHAVRVYAAMGIGRYYPGLSNEVGTELEERYGGRFLEGTSDVIGGGEQARYVEAATGYGRAYNREMARRLGVKTAGQ